VPHASRKGQRHYPKDSGIWAILVRTDAGDRWIMKGATAAIRRFGLLLIEQRADVGLTIAASRDSLVRGPFHQVVAGENQ